MMNRKEIMQLFDEKRDMTEARVKAGIEQNRKGLCKINFCDKDGKPVNSVKVKASQKSHEFRFGANIFMLDEFENDEKNLIYRKNFKEICNMATLRMT